ncbi:hypothetical protein KY362_01020 [Candidatus Woesearchaeota archaeon]|nr:hypothetical protein [Candidatus Woesearchaeota archaeon]
MSRKTRRIVFRVTDDQYRKIKLNAECKGHVTISGYLRDLALNKDGLIEQKIVEIHKAVVKK